MEFKEIEPRFKSAKTRFKLSAGLNLETYNFKWNQPYLNRGLKLNRRSNSLNSATGLNIKFYPFYFLKRIQMDNENWAWIGRDPESKKGIEMKKIQLNQTISIWYKLSIY